MIAYTTAELLGILAEPASHRDVIEVNYYVLEHKEYYSMIDLVNLLEVINCLHEMFINLY